MKAWKRFSTGAVVAFGIAALSVFGNTVHAGVLSSGVVRNGCVIFGTDFGNSCTMTEAGVNCEGDMLSLPPDSCSHWQFQMRRGGDSVCVQDVDLSSHNPTLSLPIKADLSDGAEVFSDSVCVGGTTVGGGSSGGWVTIRTGNGNDDIDFGDCSCNGGVVGDSEVYGLTNIATGRGNDQVTVDGAYFHRNVSIRVGSGADDVTVSDATLEGELEILAGTNPENTDVDTVTIEDVGFGDEVLIRTGGGNDSVTLTNVTCDGTNVPIEVDCGANGGTLTCNNVDQDCSFVVSLDFDCCNVSSVNCTEVGC